MTEATGALTEETDTSFRLGSVGKVVLGNIVKVNHPLRTTIPISYDRIQDDLIFVMSYR